MRLLAGIGLAFAVATVGCIAMRDIFSGPLFARRNYRGAAVPVGVGIVMAVAVIATDAVFVVVDHASDDVRSDTGVTPLVLVTVLGFCLLGLIDDLAAVGDERGFRGHLRALSEGRLTTGGLKLVGGGLLALVIAGAARSDGVVPLVVDALLIALAANAGNLFDRAPGRTIKVGGLALVVVLLFASEAERNQLTAVGMLLGAALGLLIFDLREQIMLGDAGSNVIGATAGLAVVLSCGVAFRVVALVAVLALNIASERVSFSGVIDRVGALRFLDRLGRRGSR